MAINVIMRLLVKEFLPQLHCHCKRKVESETETVVCVFSGIGPLRWVDDRIYVSKSLILRAEINIMISFADI